MNEIINHLILCSDGERVDLKKGMQGILGKSGCKCYEDPMSILCWAIVGDAGPTLNQHWVNISSL